MSFSPIATACGQFGGGESSTDPVADLEDAAEKAGQEQEEQTIPIPSTWKRLGNNEIWIDFNNKAVIVGGRVCLTRGGLEMFACPGQTKAHESVVSVNARASEVHAAFIALKANPGSPVQWDPEYRSVSGPIINVLARWRDPSTGRPISRWAKELIRDYSTENPLAHDWVFGGSITETDPESGQTWYYADEGELLCVSNFTTATMDLNVPSSSSDNSLMYEAFTENLPPRGTKIYLIMSPGEFFEEPITPKTKSKTSANEKTEVPVPTDEVDSESSQE